MKMKGFGVALGALGMIAGAGHAADMGAVDKPIKLVINEWTGQHVSTHVAGEMLKAAGYQVEYVTAGYMNMYQAMADGEIDAEEQSKILDQLKDADPEIYELVQKEKLRQMYAHPRPDEFPRRQTRATAPTVRHPPFFPASHRPPHPPPTHTAAASSSSRPKTSPPRP